MGGIILGLVIPTIYKSLGLSNTKISFWLSLAGMLMLCRPLIVPFIEMTCSKKNVVIFSQVFMSLSFIAVGFSLKTSSFFLVSLCVVAVLTLLVQIHDPCADGTFIEVLDVAAQTKYVGWMSAGYQIGKVICQGGIVLGAGYLIENMKMETSSAWMAAMIISGFILLIVAAYHGVVIPPTPRNENARVETTKEYFSKFYEITKEYFMKPGIWWCILFFFFYRLAEEQAMNIFGLFLIDSPAKGGLGMTIKELGMTYGFFPPIALFIGALVAGPVMEKMGGFRKAIPLFAVIYNIPLLLYGIVAYTLPNNPYLITFICCCEYFGYGFGWNGLLVCNQQYAAPGRFKTAHLAIGTAIVHGVSKLPVGLSGYMSDLLGYKHFFVHYTLAMMIPSIIIAFVVSKKLREIER
jgi:PAT family beta-lactamase induction signal transducer AmpG